MSSFSIEKPSDAELMKRGNDLIGVDDWRDKYVSFGKPSLLHKVACAKRGERDTR